MLNNVEDLANCEKLTTLDLHSSGSFRDNYGSVTFTAWAIPAGINKILNLSNLLNYIYFS